MPSVLCWTEGCARELVVTRMFALCCWCGVFAPGAKPCKLCTMVSRPESRSCDNWGRGCPETASDFEPAPTGNATPGSPAFAMGQELTAIVRAVGKDKADRQAARRTGKGGRGDYAGRGGGPSTCGAAADAVAKGSTECGPDLPPTWAPRGGGGSWAAVRRTAELDGAAAGGPRGGRGRDRDPRCGSATRALCTQRSGRRCKDLAWQGALLDRGLRA